VKQPEKKDAIWMVLDLFQQLFRCVLEETICICTIFGFSLKKKKKGFIVEGG